MVCSYMKVQAGVIAHRLRVTNVVDNKHDGDMVSANFSYDNKSKRNIDKVMSTRDFYVTPDGGLRNSPIDYIAELTIQNL